MSKIHTNSQYEDDTILDEEVCEPPLYRVLLHNDDYTSMDFVVFILVKVFRKSAEVAAEIMLSVHEKGIGICGVYTREIAEGKVAMVQIMARDAGFPLKCTCERIED